jgi:hypothetical protein
LDVSAILGGGGRGNNDRKKTCVGNQYNNLPNLMIDLAIITFGRTEHIYPVSARVEEGVRGGDFIFG